MPRDPAARGGTRAVERVLLAATIALGVTVAVSTTLQVILLHHPLPYFDEWAFVDYLVALDRGDLRPIDLWRQHNEHRLLFPRLVFFADAFWLQCKGWLPVATSLVLTFAHAGLLSRMSPVAGAAERRCSLATTAVIFALMLHASQMENFFTAFQVQFVMVFFFATASLWTLSRVKGATGRRAVGLLVLTLLLALLSWGSMASGVMVWPLLLTLAVQLRLPWRSIAVLAACGTAFVALYLIDYQSPPTHPGSLAAVLSDPLHALRWVCGLLGSPFWGLPEHWIVAAGAATLATWTFWLALQLRRWRTADPAAAARLHVVLFVLGFVGLVVYGRLGSGLGAASRYSTPVFIAWSIVAAGFLGHAKWKPIVRLGVAATVALALAAMNRADEFAPSRDGRDDAAACLMVGAPDEQAVAGASSVGWSKTWDIAGLLRKKRLSVFRDDRYRLLGTPLADAFTVRPSPLETSVLDATLELQPEPLAVVATGWAFDAGTGRAFEHLVAVDASSRIVGLGHSNIARPDVAVAYRGFPVAKCGWRVWCLNQAWDSKRPRIYVVLGDGSVAPINGQ